MGELKRSKYGILMEAEELIHGKRVQTYGDPKVTFPEIAEVASLLTGKHLTAADICLVQIALKLIRRKYTPENGDHLVDSCGYLGILSDVQECNTDCTIDETER